MTYIGKTMIIAAFVLIAHSAVAMIQFRMRIHDVYGPEAAAWAPFDVVVEAVLAVLLALVGGMSEGGGLKPAVLKSKVVSVTAEDAMGKADLLPVSSIDLLLAAAEDHLASPPKRNARASGNLRAAASPGLPMASLLTPVSHDVLEVD